MLSGLRILSQGFNCRIRRGEREKRKERWVKKRQNDVWDWKKRKKDKKVQDR